MYSTSFRRCLNAVAELNDDSGMGAYWDAKARENAMYYVSSFREYGSEDETEFYAWGKKLAAQFVAEAEIELGSDASVVEIGCGVGRMTAYFAEHAAKVIALDVSPEMLTRARERLASATNIEFRVATGSGLSGVADASADLVFSYIVLQHIPDSAIALDYLRDAGRVLRPGGSLLAQFNNMEPAPTGLGIGRRLRSLRDRLLPKGPRDLDHPAWVGSRLRLEQVREACAHHGLEDLHFRGEGTQYCWVQVQKN